MLFINLPVRKTSNDEVRKMLSKALEVSIKAAMSEHIYSFNKQLKKQAEGGAIGNVLTGALATWYMLYWAKLFANKVTTATRNLQEFELYMMKIYVDDCNLACEMLPLGSRFVGDSIEVIQDEVEADRDIPGDIRVAKLLVEIGNSVSDFINLTFDTPSMNESGWMLILDLKV